MEKAKRVFYYLSRSFGLLSTLLLLLGFAFPVLSYNNVEYTLAGVFSGQTSDPILICGIFILLLTLMVFFFSLGSLIFRQGAERLSLLVGALYFASLGFYCSIGTVYYVVTVSISAAYVLLLSLHVFASPERSRKIYAGSLLLFALIGFIVTVLIGSNLFGA